MRFQNTLRRLLTGLALLLAGPAAAQEYYEFLPDTMGARLLRQAQVQHVLWTVEDLRYQSHSPYREYTFDAEGRKLTSRYSNGPVTYTHGYDAAGQVAEISDMPSPPVPAGQPATIAPSNDVTVGSKSAFRPATMRRYDARKRPLLELRTRAGGGFDTLKTYRYTQHGDTTWEYSTATYGRLEAERNFTEDHGRVFRYDRLHYRHPKYAPEAPLYLDEVKSYYIRHDRQGRQVEDGEVNYQPALEEWISRRTDQRQELPGGFRGFVYGGGMYELQLSGKLRGDYRPTQRIFYDKKGRLSATWGHYSDGLRRFIYNAAGQVVEIQFFSQGQPDGPPGAPTGSVLLTWGTAGLPIRVERRNAAGEPDQISTYTYAHHLTLPGAGR